MDDKVTSSLAPSLTTPALILQGLKARGGDRGGGGGGGRLVTSSVLTGERQKRVVRLRPVTKMRMKTPASRSDSSRER